MPDSEPGVRQSIKLPSPWDHSSAWARVLEDGRIELELYDFSLDAQAHMGNDVAWIWRIETAHIPRLRALLEERSGAPIRDDQTFLDALARHFSHVHAIRDWLKEKGIPYVEEFDSWA